MSNGYILAYCLGLTTVTEWYIMVKKIENSVSPGRFLVSLIGASFVAVLLLTLRVQLSSSDRYIFLYWNLVLAAVPALFAWWLVLRVRKFGWLKWQQAVLTVLWVVFLPNSFYIITDLVHLRPNYEASIFYDISLLSSFVFMGLIFGYVSVYQVHQELRKRMTEAQAYGLITLLFMAISFAVFLGRYTRWNTWDIILRPAGLLFDVSDRFINPSMHQQTFLATIVLFAVTFSLYTVLYEGARIIRRS
jgi:uncharacterized membrane protein